jgi:hypothetical protein
MGYSRRRGQQMRTNLPRWDRVISRSLSGLIPVTSATRMICSTVGGVYTNGVRCFRTGIWMT